MASVCFFIAPISREISLPAIANLLTTLLAFRHAMWLEKKSTCLIQECFFNSTSRISGLVSRPPSPTKTLCSFVLAFSAASTILATVSRKRAASYCPGIPSLYRLSAFRTFFKRERSLLHGQIRAADKQSIDPRHRSDLLDVLDTFDGLDHRHDEHGIVDHCRY
jgi:hypothetical protein